MLVAVVVALGAAAAYKDPSRISTPPVYSPFPAGLLPKNLEAELKRVEAEINGIEQKTLAEWRALPIRPDTRMKQVQILGKLELYDTSLSVNRNMACTSCHMPYTGFTGPISSLNASVGTYPGSVRYRFSSRMPLPYTYAAYFPALHYNKTQEDFYGGNFWDLRATGDKLQNPAAAQAQDPPVDPDEMGFPDSACVVYRLSQAPYRPLFETVWGPQAFAISWPPDIEQTCTTPAGAAVFHGNKKPVNLSPIDRGRSDATYDQFAQAIAAAEYSPEESAFSSKFDYALAHPDKKVLSDDELAGWELYRGKGKCNTCHLDGTASRKGSAAISPGDAANAAPLFTDFTSANLGLPKNRANPYYFETTPDAYGFTANPAGASYTDLGVGLFLRSRSGTDPNEEWAPLAPKFDGFMQVTTVRNVDMRPCPEFVKAYMHNGYLKSLKEVVHFYNTRDVYAHPVLSGQCPPGTVEKVTCWPQPEVPQTKNMTIGKLGLTDHEEDLIVKFMQTLTDGYARPYPDAKSYTGSCSAAGAE